MKRLTPETIFISDNLSQDLAEKSVRGGMATMGSQGVSFVLRMASTMVLARLLTPSDYGLIGMVTVVVNFATMFKDAGLSMATVQKDNISHEQISTLFWINVLISIVLGVCVLVGSPLVAAFYGKPELTAVTAVFSISFIPSGLSIQHAALLRRHMRFGSLAVVQIAAQVISLAVAILLALYGWRYWALVGGSLTTAFATVVLTFFFCPWVPGRMRKGTGVRKMLKFGGHLTGFNFINYFSRNADSILIGRFIGADALGLYTKAYQLFMMPISQIRAPITNVAMPVLSSLKDQPERYVKYYQRLIDIMATLTIPLTLYCFVEAEFLIGLVLGAQWLGAVPVFRVLAVAGVLQSITSTAGLVQLSFGYSARYFKWGVVGAFVFVGSFIIGLPYGIVGVATSYACANLLITFPTLFYCYHKTPVSVSLFLRTLIMPLLISGVAAGSLIAIKLLTDNSILNHLFALCIFSFVYGGLSICRKPVRETVKLFTKDVPFFSSRKASTTIVP